MPYMTAELDIIHYLLPAINSGVVMIVLVEGDCVGGRINADHIVIVYIKS